MRSRRRKKVGSAFDEIDPLTPLPPSRHPFQFWVLAAAWLIGWIVLLDDPDTDFKSTIPDFFFYVWGVLLVTGSTVAVFSAWWTDRITGLMMERAALLSLFFANVSYGPALLYSFGLDEGPSGIFALGVSAASLWRARQIKTELAVLAYVARLNGGE